jgi:hypothetical protein
MWEGWNVRISLWVSEIGHGVLSAEYLPACVSNHFEPEALACGFSPLPLNDSRFVVRRDWDFAESGKLAAIFQELYRSEDNAKISSQTEGNVSSPSTRSQTLVFLSDSPRLTTKF